jgi:hypothetical protein
MATVAHHTVAELVETHGLSDIKATGTIISSRIRGRVTGEANGMRIVGRRIDTFILMVRVTRGAAEITTTGKRWGITTTTTSSNTTIRKGTSRSGNPNMHKELIKTELAKISTGK